MTGQPEQVDVVGSLMAGHGAIALTALVRLAETAERHDRLHELPASVLDAMNALPAAVQRWQAGEGGRPNPHPDEVSRPHDWPGGDQ